MHYHKLLPIEEKALDLYMEWLNAWAAKHDGAAAWTVYRDQFFSEHWTETCHMADLSVGYHHLYIMSAGTGDEGGPATLYIWGSEDDDKGPLISSIVQEFDSYYQEIYNADKGGLVLEDPQ